MFKTVFGALSAIAAPTWWFSWETIKAAFFEQVVHAINPFVGGLLHYGVPALFVGGCVWLWWPQIITRIPWLLRKPCVRSLPPEGTLSSEPGQPQIQPITDLAAPPATGSEFVSLKEAATRLHSAWRRTGSPFAMAAERLSGTGAKLGAGAPDDVLNWTATYLSSRIPVFGKRPPSDVLEEISADDLGASTFREGATILRDKMDDETAFFTELTVRAAQLDRFLVRLTARAQHET